MTALTRVSTRMAAALSVVAGVALMATIVLLLTNVVFRLLGSPLQGTYELVQLLAVVVLGLALAGAQVDRAHVAIDLAMKGRPLNVQLLAGAGVTVLSILIFGLLAVALWRYGQNQLAVGSGTESLGIPLWPWVMALMLGVVALVLVLVSDLVRILVAARTKDTSDLPW